MKQEISASFEDYLEAIYNIIEEKSAVRVKDIAKLLKVTNASVSGALKNLNKMGLVNYAPYDIITLTKNGEIAAREVIKKHDTLRKFFTEVLGITEEEADKEACVVEHTISDNILNRLEQFVEYSTDKKGKVFPHITKFKNELN